MAKRKVRAHPGALAELLKRKNMTQMEVASDGVIDRKTLAKINRGEEVKPETLQKLANKLKVPTTYFDPPADNSVSRVDSKPNDPRWLNLTLRKVDAERLAKMLSGTERVNWQLNVHTFDDETIQFLEQLEDAVEDIHGYLTSPPDPEGGVSLKLQLGELKRSRHVASLLEELAKHHLAILGAEYLSWQTETGIDPETNCPYIIYQSWQNVLFSVEGHPAYERRTDVWHGTVPPRFAPWGTHVSVDGRILEIDPAVIKERQRLEMAAAENQRQALKAIFGQVSKSGAKQKVSNSEASSEDRNAQ
jgi:transcriptional regulator with XRE-family HTH domain